MILETERLYLREFTSDDYSQLTSFASHPDITRWLSDWLDCEEWGHSWLKMVIRHYEINDPYKKFLEYAVIEKKTDVMIGHIGCGDFEKKDIGICYAIDPSCQQKGYAVEIMRAFLEYLFCSYKLPRIIATIQPDNIASVKTAERCGFEYIKTITMLDNGQTEPLPFRFYTLYPNSIKGVES